MFLGVLNEESDESILKVFNGSDVMFAGYPLKDSPSKHELLNVLKGLLPRELQVFVKYFAIQVARGNFIMPRGDESTTPFSHFTSGIAEDTPMFIKTLEGFMKYNKKAAWGDRSKNIYDYKNWRALKDEVVKVEDVKREYGEDMVDSKVLFTKSYVSPGTKHTSFGPDGKLMEQDFVTTYWLRQLLTIEGAYKYGRGTHWCTAMDPTQFKRPEDSHAYSYLKRVRYEPPDMTKVVPGAPLKVASVETKDLFIVEMKKTGGKRKPLLQLSPEHDTMTGVQDQEVSRIGRGLAIFFAEAANAIDGTVDPMSVKYLRYKALHSGHVVELREKGLVERVH